VSSLFSDIQGLHTDKEPEPQIDFVPTKFSAKWFVWLEKAQIKLWTPSNGLDAEMNQSGLFDGPGDIFI
jgi:hypothetical protein